MKRGIHTTADRCSGKFASLKKKFNEINDQIPEANKGKRVQWPFFSRMNQVLGLEDSSTLEHVHGVGAATSKKRSRDSTPSPTRRPSSENSQETRSRRQKGKITNSESISRLIDLEMDRAAMDKEFLAEIKQATKRVLLNLTLLFLQLKLLKRFQRLSWPNTEESMKIIKWPKL